MLINRSAKDLMQKHTMQKKRTMQKGVSMFELIVVLAIMGSIMVGVSVVISRAMTSFNINTLVNNVVKIQLVMLQVYNKGGSNKYPQIGTDEKRMEQLKNSLIQMGFLEKADFINPFNAREELGILTSDYNTNPHRAFLIHISSLSQEECRLTILNLIDLFEYVYVGDDGDAASIDDIYTDSSASSGKGAIKTPRPGSAVFDSSNLTHIENLCSSSARDGNFRIYLGTH